MRCLRVVRIIGVGVLALVVVLAVVVARADVPAWATMSESERFYRIVGLPSGKGPRPERNPTIPDMATGEPVRPADLSNLPPGMQAFRIRVRAETIAGGFIYPGCFVDIVLIPNEGSPVRSIVEDTMVLAVLDVQCERIDGVEEVFQPYDVAVTATQARKLQEAAPLGDFRLLLRPLR
jgi:Flp pilus assembly protein CpaB